jgi:hypothetical protein
MAKGNALAGENFFVLFCFFSVFETSMVLAQNED